MIRKFICFILLLIFCPCAFGAEYMLMKPFDKNNGIYKFKTNIADNRWGLFSEKDGIIFNQEFRSFKKFDDKTFLASKQKNWKTRLKGEYNKDYGIYLKIIGQNPSDIFEKFYKTVNENSIIKFKNYPKEGIIEIKNKNKFGMIVFTKDDIIIFPCVFDGINFPDSKSLIYRYLGISYAGLNELWVTFENKKQTFNGTNEIYENDAKVCEELLMDGSNVTLVYNGMHEMCQGSPKSFDPEYSSIVRNAYFLDYPTKRWKLDKGLFYGEEKIPIDEDIFKSYIAYFPPEITLMPKKRNEFISDLNFIMLHNKKNKKYGAINKEGKIIAECIYDEIITTPAIIREEMDTSMKNTDINGIKFYFKGMKIPQSDIFLAEKDGKISVINSKGKVIISNSEMFNLSAVKNFTTLKAKINKEALPKNKNMRKFTHYTARFTSNVINIGEECIIMFLAFGPLLPLTLYLYLCLTQGI